MTCFVCHLFIIISSILTFEVILLTRVNGTQINDTSKLPQDLPQFYSESNEESNKNKEYETYSPRELLRIILLDINTTFYSNDHGFKEKSDTVLKNSINKYENSSEKFCNDTKKMNIYSNKASAPVKYFLKVIRDPANCTFLCTINLKKNLMPSCPLILLLYNETLVNENNSTIRNNSSGGTKEISNLNKTVDAAINPSNSSTFDDKLEHSTELNNMSINKSQSIQDNSKKNNGNLNRDDGNANDKPNFTIPAIQGAIPDDFGNEDSHYFVYFFIISILCIGFYVVMYNKKKILALMIEGRKRNIRKRPNSAGYSKLDCNLEEAMASGPSTSNSNTLLY